MSTAPKVLVVGAGPAGVSAVLWARSIAFRCELLERTERPGGQLHQVYFPLENVAGAAALSGAELAMAMGHQLADHPVRFGAEVAALDPERAAVRLRSGEWVEGDALLIATGVRRRQLQIPGAEALLDRGVSYSATRDRARFAGRSMVVVGGGDAAYENARMLADAGCRVLLAVRGQPRAHAAFRARVAAAPAIEVLDDLELLAILGEDRVRAVRYRDATGEHERAVEGVVVKIGVVPNSESLQGSLALDDDGYVRVDATLRSSHPRAWAAGDVTRPPVFGVPVAWGHGALAIASIRAALRGR